MVKLLGMRMQNLFIKCSNEVNQYDIYSYSFIYIYLCYGGLCEFGWLQVHRRAVNHTAL